MNIIAEKINELFQSTSPVGGMTAKVHKNLLASLAKVSEFAYPKTGYA